LQRVYSEKKEANDVIQCIITASHSALNVNKDTSSKKSEKQTAIASLPKCNKKKKIPHRPRSVTRQLIPCRPLSWRGWNEIKLAYK